MIETSIDDDIERAIQGDGAAFGTYIRTLCVEDI